VTYNVFDAMLNLTQSINQSGIVSTEQGFSPIVTNWLVSNIWQSLPQMRMLSLACAFCQTFLESCLWRWWHFCYWWLLLQKQTLSVKSELLDSGTAQRTTTTPVSEELPEFAAVGIV